MNLTDNTKYATQLKGLLERIGEDVKKAKEDQDVLLFYKIIEGVKS